MRIKDHIILATVAFCAWLFYYVIGIPSDCFQNWSFSNQIILSLITFFSAALLISFVTIILLNRNYLKTGIWLAFYGSILLALLDFIIYAVIQRGGIKIFITHWYITIGYLYVWLIGPIMGLTLHKFRRELEK